MPDTQPPAPGGWNQIQIEVENLEATVAELKRRGTRFRNEIVTGNSGKQILIEDPSGNPIELFQLFGISSRRSPPIKPTAKFHSTRPRALPSLG